MSFNELDSLMMQADIANQEARERGSMSKHTPGPWGVEWQRPCYWLIRDEFGCGVHMPPGDSIDDPNRLLIERAPETKRQRDELLAALELLADAYEAWGPECRTLRMAREAINSATKEEA